MNIFNLKLLDMGLLRLFLKEEVDLYDYLHFILFDIDFTHDKFLYFII